MPHRHSTAQPKIDQDILRCLVDATGRMVFVSPALGWAAGASAAALTGRPAREIIDIVSCLDSKQATLDLAEIESGLYEVALLRKKRAPLLVQARIDRVDAPGEGHYTVVWIDPENRLREQEPEEARRAAQAFAVYVGDAQAGARGGGDAGIMQDDSELRHFLNITNDLLGVYARDLSFVRVNPAFNRLFDYSDADLRMLSFMELVHPDDRKRVAAEVQKVLDTPQGGEMRVDFECRNLSRHGHIREIAWIFKSAGAYLYIVGHDVTDIRRHEAELGRRERQLSEAQKIGRMGHWYWRAGEEEMEWSDQIYDIFGVSKDRFRPVFHSINALILKRDLSYITRALEAAVTSQKDYEIEFRIRRPDGSVRYIRSEGRCKVDPRTGATEALFGIMQDITERTLHESALRAAKESAEHAYASKTRFLANMSHELRTPLNAIIGFSEMIQRQLLGPIGNPRYLDYIGGIRESGEHLLDLINDILDMSKIEVGKYELHVEEMKVGKIIRLAIHMVEGRAHESQVRLIASDIDDGVQITADRRALMQILLNLLSNAVKFTPAGGTVEVRCVRDISGVMIVVSDTGVGIPRDKLDIVTLPFEQVDSEMTRRHEGSGLGLAITKDLIELHGGTLEMDSDVGRGTTVTVLLPETVPETRNVRRVEGI